ncbi:MAG: hypothetical protein DA408_14835 [Bacteroidetes bacterium]|nr:MAG: hypothetical protein C7N36_09845 [Bacteroidota bacterium]PTM10899.1 MAG: hypothetical protein DA408_14835 [Bacteroidota bacterium]
MKFQLNIEAISTIDEIADAWSNADFVALLDQLNYPDADPPSSKEELRELLFMAIADFAPPEAAAIVLTYLLADQLTAGQIQQISHDMLIDKISEEYPEIALHYPLFNTNELLYKAYNGKFPHVKATVIELEFKPQDQDEVVVTKELILQAFREQLSDRNVITRLFAEQLTGKEPFPEAEHIIWELHTLGNDRYTLITSEYWLADDDFLATSFAGELAELKAEKHH